MAALPQATVDPIADLIFKAYEANAEDGRRPHLGASIIGRPCSRDIWYSFRWASTPKHEGRVLRLFETGHLAEQRFVDNLRAIGVTVSDTTPDGAQWRVAALGGHFAGSLDGAVTNVPGRERQWLVLECKTHGAKSFARLRASGVRESKPEHVAQMQCYMHLTGLERALYFAVNKDTDDLHTEIIHYDGTEAKRLLDRAEMIIKSDEPPPRISDRPDWHECRYCDHRDICHGERAPEASCRTCAHATPRIDGAGGAWHCGAPHMAASPMLSIETQRNGCAAHRIIPIMLAKTARPIDFVDGDVIYELADGSRFANGNGPRAFTSAEIAKVESPRVLPGYAELKADFPAAKLVKLGEKA